MTSERYPLPDGPALAVIQATKDALYKMCDPLWGKGPEFAKICFDTDIERLTLIREMLLRLEPNKVQEHWKEIRQIFYDARSCPYCAMSGQVVQESELGAKDDRILINGKFWKISCMRCPIAFMALSRNFEPLHGCHNQPEYKALTHARGDKDKALAACEEVIRGLQLWEKVAANSKCVLGQ